NGLEARNWPGVTPGVAPLGHKRSGSRRAERAGRLDGKETRRIRPGTLTPEWPRSRGSGRCGRAKGRYERTVPVGSKRAASQEALIPKLEKTAAGEQRGETSSAFNCDVRCRACRRRAGLGFGSLGTIFFGRADSCLTCLKLQGPH